MTHCAPGVRVGVVFFFLPRKRVRSRLSRKSRNLSAGEGKVEVSLSRESMYVVGPKLD